MASITDYLNNKAGEISKLDDKQSIGINGFDALVHIRQRLTRTADIPTSPLENGSFANDHIILNPLRIEIEGWVMDIILRPSPVRQLHNSFNKNLGVITKYGPEWTQAQQQKISSLAMTAMDAANRIDSVLNDGRTLLNLSSPDDTSESNAKKFLADMLWTYESRTPFPIEIEGELYNDMFMVSWSTDFDNEAKNGLKYSMTLQQLSFVNIAYSKASPAPNPSEAVKNQVAGKVAKSVNEGEVSSLLWHGGGFSK